MFFSATIHSQTVQATITLILHEKPVSLSTNMHQAQTYRNFYESLNLPGDTAHYLKNK